MLRELSHVRQIPDDYFRRCFVDEVLDLLVWYKPDESIYGFQLCYDRLEDPKVVTWTEERGMSHARLDDGEGSPFANRTPILLYDSNFDPARLLAGFLSSAENLPSCEREFIQQKLSQTVSR